MKIEYIKSDSLIYLKSLDDNCIDTIITDPPYGISFMSKEWDKQIPPIEYWKEMLRVAKPGSTIMAFGGTRTFHRLACLIEDVGWKYVDTLSWIYSVGFPKSLDISKAIDKKNGAERKVVGQYQPPGMDSPWNLKNAKDERTVDVFSISRNNLDITEPATEDAKTWDGYGTSLKPAWEPIIVAQKPIDGNYVENALNWGVAGYNIKGASIPIDKDKDASQLRTMNRGSKGDQEGWGMNKNGADNPQVIKEEGRYPTNLIFDKEAADILDRIFEVNGGPSRFFYCTKPSKREKGEYNNHPTVKPISLMEYLCLLTRTPTGGKVLDPFCGSGTTGLACFLTGRDFVGIDIGEDNIELCKRRLQELKEKTTPIKKDIF